MRKIATVFIFSVGLGQLIYLGEYFLNGVKTIPLSVFLWTALLSGLIGVFSTLLFDMECPRVLKLCLHYLGILGLVLLVNWINFKGLGNSVWLHRFITISFIFEFSFIYLIVWSILIAINHQRVIKINKQLFKRKQDR